MQACRQASRRSGHLASRGSLFGLQGDCVPKTTLSLIWHISWTGLKFGLKTLVLLVVFAPVAFELLTILPAFVRGEHYSGPIGQIAPSVWVVFAVVMAAYLVAPVLISGLLLSASLHVIPLPETALLRIGPWLTSLIGALAVSFGSTMITHRMVPNASTLEDYFLVIVYGVFAAFLYFRLGTGLVRHVTDRRQGLLTAPTQP